MEARQPEEAELGAKGGPGCGRGGGGRLVGPLPQLSKPEEGSVHTPLSAPGPPPPRTSVSFLAGGGVRRKERKRGGTGAPIRLSALTQPSVIECSFPVTGPAQSGPFTGSPSRLPGNQATASAPGPLNSSSKPLNQQLPELGGGCRGRGTDARPGGGSGVGAIRREGGPWRRGQTKARKQRKTFCFSDPF